MLIPILEDYLKQKEELILNYAENKKLSFSHVIDITTSLYEGAMFNRIKSLLGNDGSKMGRTNTWLKD